MAHTTDTTCEPHGLRARIAEHLVEPGAAAKLIGLGSAAFSGLIVVGAVLLALV